MKKFNSKTYFSNPYVGYILFGLFLMMFPILVQFGLIKSNYISIMGGVIIYSIAALGLNLLLGWSGLISLGTAGFMGLAAYLSAYLTADLKVPFEVALIVSVLIPTLIGLLVGAISLRIEGLYLAIATLAVSEILRKTFSEFQTITNGFSGKSIGFPKLLGLFKSNAFIMYFVLVLCLVFVMILIHNLVSGQTGRAMNAMRGSEAAAQAMGINLIRTRLMAFALATGLASLSGVLYMQFNKYTYPATWTLGMSLNLLAAIVIGGVRNIYGTILGVFIVFAVPDLVLKQIPYFGSIPNFAYIVNGLLIILVIMFYPAGLIQIKNDIKRLFNRKGALK